MGAILSTKSESPSLLRQVTRCKGFLQQSEDGPAHRPLILPPYTFGEILVIGICAYELMALGSQSKVPPITSLCRNRRWIEVGLLAILLGHLHVYREGDTWTLKLT